MGTDGSGFTVLHSFTGSDGNRPTSSLNYLGSILYGTTEYGGTSNCGTIFKLSADGTGFTSLYSFGGSTSDGQYPMGDLMVDGSMIYGTTYGQMVGADGTLFSISTGGGDLTLLHSFGGSDGRNPEGGLALYGSEPVRNDRRGR